MLHRSIALAFAAALLLSSPLCLAADKAATAQPAASQSKANPHSKKPKLVDINRASAAQLKTVPGIGDAEAEMIIKGRPYPTKAHLVTENVLTFEAYVALKDRIVAIPVNRPKAKK